jgi:hypothetical protein
MRRLALILALLGSLLSSPAMAEDFVNSAQQTKNSPGVVLMCWTSAQLYLPCGPATPLSVTGSTSAAVGTMVAATTTAITTGGTSQTLFTAGTVSNGGFVTNPTTATEVLCVNPVGTAATVTASGATFCLAAGQTFTLPSGITNAVTVNAATTAHAFSAVRY